MGLVGVGKSDSFFLVFSNSLSTRSCFEILSMYTKVAFSALIADFFASKFIKLLLRFCQSLRHGLPLFFPRPFVCISRLLRTRSIQTRTCGEGRRVISPPKMVRSFFLMIWRSDLIIKRTYILLIRRQLGFFKFKAASSRQHPHSRARKIAYADFG